MTDEIELGKRLKAARQRAGLTQKELSLKTSLPQSYISRIECGNQTGSITTLKALAKATGTDASLLIGLQQPATAATLDTAEAIAERNESPAGLVALATDSALCASLNITAAEWLALSSLVLPKPTDKQGYMTLLLTIRSVTKS